MAAHTAQPGASREPAGSDSANPAKPDASASPASPADLAQRYADDMYAADHASQQLGISVEGVAPGQARARMRVTPAMVNGHGTAHGGYVFLLADSAFAFACNTYGPTTVARSAEIVFVSPVREGDDLLATAVERVTYGRSGVYDVTVRRIGTGDTGDTGDGEIVAEFRGQSQQSQQSQQSRSRHAESR